MKPILEKRKRYLIDGLLDFRCGEGGSGSFANCTICFLPLSPCSIFSGVIAQHPNRSVPKMLSGPTTFHVMKEFGYICITRVVVVGFFYITERISSDNFRK